MTSISPSTAVAGASAFQLTVNGQNFASTANVLWNGNSLTTAFVSATQLTASVPAANVATAGTAQISVSSGGATTSALPFTITQVVPTISSLNPSTIYAGSSSFTLNITGSNFVSGAVVQFAGTTVTPTYTTATTISVTIPATLVSTAGNANVTVTEALSSGQVTSAPATFTIAALPTGQFTLSQVANDIAADPVRGLLYASVPSTAAANGNAVITIDPKTGTVTNSTFVGSEPDLLAVSPDGNLLYVALDGSSQVKCFALPAMTLSFTVSLGANSFFGANTALDLAASNSPGIWAVTSGNLGVSPAAQAGVQVYNGSTPVGASVGRNSNHGGFDLLLGAIVWGKDATVLYGANNESTGFDLYKLAVSSSGIGTITDYGGAMPGFNNRHIHFEPATGYVYGDSGYVVDPSSGQAAGQFAYNGPMTTDGTLGLAFFVNTNTPMIIASYDLTKFLPENIFKVPNVQGTPVRLVRVGPNGLAFNALSSTYNGTSFVKSGQIFIYAGSLVK